MGLDPAAPHDSHPPSRDGGGLVPTVIAERYELELPIGSGGMARVYRARDRVLQRPVAVKILREEHCADPDFVARFSREARAAASLQHANIVDVYDYGEQGDRYYIVMQYVDGADLKAVLRERGALPVAVAITIMSQVLRGLAAAHERGIVHRDIKPHNILVHGDNLVKLTDFGIARLLAAGSVTTSAATLGTASYMAPEQASGGPIGPGVDLYSCGVVLFELLTGRLPFVGDSPLQVLMKHLHEPPPRIADVSPAVEHVVRRALAKNPAERFTSATAMLAALSAAGARYTRGDRPVAGVSDQAAVTRAIGIQGAGQLRGRARARAGSWPAVSAVLLLVLLLLSAVFVWSKYLSMSRGATPIDAAATPPILAPPTVVAAQERPPVPTATATSQPTTAPPTVVAAAPAAEPTALPTPTRTPVPTATARPTAVVAPTATKPPPTAPAPTATVRAPAVAPPTATATPRPVVLPATIRLGPETLGGGYRRTDGTLYGRPTSALYGAGSPYSEASTTFQWSATDTGTPLALLIAGLDDERVQFCDWEVALNGVVVYRGPTRLPNAPTNDNGVGGPDRYWGTVRIPLPSGALHSGPNTLTIANLTPWDGFLGIPYILVNEVAVGQ